MPSFVQSDTPRYRILTADGPGVIPGIDLSLYDLAPGKTLRIVGNFELVTPTTGVFKGTAGAGTTTTSLVKPTGAANWTASDLIGKYVRIVGGGGAPADFANGEQVLRPILANSTTALTVNAISGMDTTTRFQIVDLASLVDEIDSSTALGIKIRECYIPVEIYGLDFTNANTLDSLISAVDSTSIYIEGCNISYNTANPAIDIERCHEVDINHCVLTGSGDISVQTCFSFQSVGLDARIGGVVLAQDCFYASVTKYTSDDAASRVLSMVHVLNGQAEVNATDGGATPIYLESVANFTAVGTLLIGANAGAAYGIEIDKSGQYTLTGSTIAGAADVLFMNNAVTWANLSSGTYGIAEEHAGNAIANSSYSKALKYGNYTFLETVEFSSRVLNYGINNPSQITGLTALGTTSADAYVMLQQNFYRFDTVAAGTGARLIAAATVALPGVIVTVMNNGANALLVYPPVGGTINALGVDAGYSLAVGAVQQFIYVSDNCLTVLTH